jgi:hypothetical protein
VLLSASANASEFVIRDVEWAVTRGVPLVPLQVDNTSLLVLDNADEAEPATRLLSLDGNGHLVVTTRESCPPCRRARGS